MSAGRGAAAPPPATDRQAPVDVIAIGCSAGGPSALQALLPALPRHTRTTVLVAQHMPERFTVLFTDRLRRACRLPVVRPADGEPFRSGRIYMAPGGHQTFLDRVPGRIVFRVRPRAASERYAPCADILMESVARLFGARALGLLMTGMGGDGVEGLRAIKRRRGRTIAESEETAVVFGMPREAIRAGLADRVLALPEITETVAALCR